MKISILKFQEGKFVIVAVSWALGISTVMVDLRSGFCELGLSVFPDLTTALFLTGELFY